MHTPILGMCNSKEKKSSFIIKIYAYFQLTVKLLFLDTFIVFTLSSNTVYS